MAYIACELEALPQLSRQILYVSGGEAAETPLALGKICMYQLELDRNRLRNVLGI